MAAPRRVGGLEFDGVDGCVGSGEGGLMLDLGVDAGDNDGSKSNEAEDSFEVRRVEVVRRADSCACRKAVNFVIREIGRKTGSPPEEATM